MVNEDLSSVFILDNSPGAYQYNPGKYDIYLATVEVNMTWNLLQSR